MIKNTNVLRRITLGKGTWPQVVPYFYFNHPVFFLLFFSQVLLFCFFLLPFSEASGEAKGGEQTSHLQGRTESQQEKKGNKTKAQKSGSFEGFQVPLSGEKKEKFSCDSEMFYIEKEAGMKSADWRGRKGTWRPLPSARPLSSSTPAPPSSLHPTEPPLLQDGGIALAGASCCPRAAGQQVGEPHSALEVLNVTHTMYFFH